MFSVMIDAQTYKVDEVEHIDLHVDVRDGFELNRWGWPLERVGVAASDMIRVVQGTASRAP
jgi:hypothetical protein